MHLFLITWLSHDHLEYPALSCYKLIFWVNQSIVEHKNKHTWGSEQRRRKYFPIRDGIELIQRMSQQYNGSHGVPAKALASQQSGPSSNPLFFSTRPLYKAFGKSLLAIENYLTPHLPHNSEKAFRMSLLFIMFKSPQNGPSGYKTHSQLLWHPRPSVLS